MGEAQYKGVEGGLKSGFYGSVFNLMNAAVGSGIIGLPYAAASTGYAIFVVFLLLVAAMAMFSIDLLCQAGEYYGVTSYEDIAYETFQKKLGRGMVGLRLAAFFILAAATVSLFSYFSMLKSELPELVKFMLMMGDSTECYDSSAWYVSGSVLMLIIVFVVIMPIAFAKHLDFLKFASAGGMFSMALCILTIVVFKFIESCSDIVSSPLTGSAVQCADNSTQAAHSDWNDFMINLESMGKSDQACKAVAFQISDGGRLFDGIHNLFFSFLCHDVVLSVFAELRNGSRAKMQKVTRTAFFFIAVLYLASGLFGYFTWYEGTISEILLTYSLNHSDSLVIFMARLFVMVTITFSVPIVHYACRKSFCMLLFGKYVIQENEGSSKITQLALQFGYPIVYLGLIALVVIKASGIQVFFGIGGGITHPSLYVLFPPMLWLMTFGLKANKDESFVRGVLCCIMVVTAVLLIGYDVYVAVAKAITSM